MYTAEFKEAAVPRLKDGQSVSVWPANRACRCRRCATGSKRRNSGAEWSGALAVTAEQMELSRLRAENKRAFGGVRNLVCRGRSKNHQLMAQDLAHFGRIGKEQQPLTEVVVSPLPVLAAVDAVALLVVLALVYVIRRRKHAQTRQ